MGICELCDDQVKKSRNGRPHEYLRKFDECRIFKGIKPRGYEEQDYQCLRCQAKFTWSSDRNNLAWTLWQG